LEYLGSIPAINEKIAYGRNRAGLLKKNFIKIKIK